MVATPTDRDGPRVSLVVPAPLVSIVIPILRDASELEGLLAGLAADAAGDAVEVVVVSGDATDRALDALRVRFPAVRWGTSPVGRGPQMNAGAAAAAGRWLLFVHADARLDPGWLDEIRAADRRDDVVGGAFRFILDSSRRVARLIEWGVATRVSWFALPYGDQALFVRRAVFEALDGYRAIPLMEDVDLIRRLGRRGSLWFSPVPARVSPRRWERDGWLRRSALNVMLVLLYFAGVSPEWLARRDY